MFSRGYGAVTWGSNVSGRILGRIFAYGLTRRVTIAPRKCLLCGVECGKYTISDFNR